MCGKCQDWNTFLGETSEHLCEMSILPTSAPPELSYPAAPKNSSCPLPLAPECNLTPFLVCGKGVETGTFQRNLALK